MIRQSSPASRSNRLANRKASPFSKRSVAHAFRVMAPTLAALTFASAAHAQGTMDFSGAQTLMGTFKTFAVYAGAVICFGGLIFAGIRMMSGRFQFVSCDVRAILEEIPYPFVVDFGRPMGAEDARQCEVHEEVA